MFHAYIFQCEANDRFDVGFTDDLERCYQEHVRMLAKTPGLNPPNVRIFSETYPTEEEAEERSHWMKRWDRETMIKALDR